MSEKKTQVPNNVVAIGSGTCKSEACKAKASRFEFCDEHFAWFKEGLVTKDGKKCADFEKKYYQYMSKKKQAA